jgi:Uncharacterised protein family UPF0547
VDHPDYVPPEPEAVEPDADGDKPKPRYAITPLSFALVCIGAAAMAVAAFLPFLDATGIFSRVKQNTLIEHEGWPLLLFALLAVLTGYRNYSEGQRGWSTILWGALGLAVAVWIASDKTIRTLYPIGLNGEPIGTGRAASIGIGIYVAGVGGIVTAFGGLQMRNAAVAAPAATEQPTKQCPDCAETVLAAANVCRFCGHRFADDPATAAT